MAVYAFYQKNEMQGSTSVDGGQRLDINWECWTDTGGLTPGHVIAALDTVVGITKGSPHPQYAYALCVDITATVWRTDPFRWDVRANFSEPRPQPGASDLNPAGGQPTPTDQPAFFRGGFRREDAYQLVDFDGYDYTDSAGKLLESPPPVGRCVGQIVITRNYTAVSYTGLKAMENKVNSATWQGFPAHSLLIEGVEWEPVTERGIPFMKVTYTIAHKDVTPEQEEIVDWSPPITGGWLPTPVLDVGYYELVGGEARPIYEPPGSREKTQVPQLLNGITGVRDTVARYLGFTQYEQILFDYIDT